MEHPPKQGLKQTGNSNSIRKSGVLMEHPPKQGLKLLDARNISLDMTGFNGTSTKTRIETGVRTHVQN